MSSNLKIDIKALAGHAGLLKVVQTVFGSVCLGIMLYYTTASSTIYIVPNFFFCILVVFTFLVSTFLLLISYLFEGEFLQKSMFEVIHHTLASLLYFCASVILGTMIAKTNTKATGFGNMVFTMVLGFANSGLYLASLLVAFKHIRAG